MKKIVKEVWVVDGPVRGPTGRIWDNIHRETTVKPDRKNKRNSVLKRIAVVVEKENGFAEGGLYFGDCDVYFEKRIYASKNIQLTIPFP